jgi:two-component system response regulator LytT
VSTHFGLSVLAVDDELPALTDLARLLRGSPSVDEVTCAHSGSEALRLLTERQFHALFLDVRMPGLSGLELAAVIYRFAAPPAIVFVSAYEEGAARAFEVHALDYLLKPVSRSRVEDAVARVTEARAGQPKLWASAEAAEVISRTGDSSGNHLISVEYGSEHLTRLIERDSIMYVQARGDYVRLVSDEGRFLQRSTLADIENRWRSYGFHRVHRAYLVNLRWATGLRADHGATASVVLTDGTQIPVARRQLPQLRRRLRI